MIELKLSHIMQIHEESSYNRPALEETGHGGCFYCQNLVKTGEIEEWVDGEATAICPKCGIDSLIPYHPFSEREKWIHYLLSRMNEQWFGRSTKMSDDYGINALCQEAYMYAAKKGFWDDNANVPTKIALIHSEVSEMLEEFRKNKMELYYETDPEGKQKPEGFGVELADAVIRLADLAGHLGLDLAELVRIKMAYNATRPFKHGNKKI